MDNNKRLIENLRKAFGPVPMALCQGIITGISDDGLTCSCRFGSAEVSEIRLRASLSGRDRQMLVVPRLGSAVIVGSLSGDLSSLVVLQVDEIDRVVFNGGELGGLVNIEPLTEKLNALVDAFNSHTHHVTTSGTAASQTGTAAATTGKAEKFDKNDYEDANIIH